MYSLTPTPFIMSSTPLSPSLPPSLPLSQVQAISRHLPLKKQVLLFSATIPPKIESLALETLHNPLFISVGMVSLLLVVMATVVRTMLA